MKVCILVTVPRPELLDNCTLVFKTLRVGFPTVQIDVFDNVNNSDVWNALALRTKQVDGRFITCRERYHHGKWIQAILKRYDEPVVILDPDVILWENCENLQFARLYAGYYTPMIWNEFAKCISAPRIHTSFMWFNDPQRLLRDIKNRYPEAHDSTGAYSPCNPFMPDVKFLNGRPMFWDTCANLYNMIPGTHFDDDVLLKYDHVPSSSFYDVMKDRVSTPKGFEWLHKTAVTNPTMLRNMWPGVNDYYQRMNQAALKCLT